MLEVFTLVKMWQRRVRLLERDILRPFSSLDDEIMFEPSW